MRPDLGGSQILIPGEAPLERRAQDSVPAAQPGR